MYDDFNDFLMSDSIRSETIRYINKEFVNKRSKTIAYELLPYLESVDSATRTLILKYIDMAERIRLSSWAEYEIDYLRANSDEYLPKYVDNSSLNAALSAYKNICGQGRSAKSINAIKEILNELLSGNPLTSIEDIPSMWDQCGINVYQHKRYRALFKFANNVGDSEYYRDINRFRCCRVGTSTFFHSDAVDSILHDMFPIRFPYYPKIYDVTVDMRLFPDFDTIGILSIEQSDGTFIIIDRYFTKIDKQFKEISREKYEGMLPQDTP